MSESGFSVITARSEGSASTSTEDPEDKCWKRRGRRRKLDDMYEDISDDSFSTISQSDMVVIDEVGDEDYSRDISPARRVVDLGIWHRIRSADDSGRTTSLDVNTSSEIRVGNQSTPRLRTCQLCDFRPTMLKRHMIKMHLPWYVAAATACFQCKSQYVTPSALAMHMSSTHHSQCSEQQEEENMNKWCRLINGLLHFLRQAFNLPSLDSLRNFVIKENLFPALSRHDLQFTEKEQPLMYFYVRTFSGEDFVDTFSACPPNHVISLIHWRTLCNLLVRLNPTKREFFRELSSEIHQSGFSLNLMKKIVNPNFTDSHFHLDQVLAKSKCDSLKTIEDATGRSDGCLSYAVANYVYPDAWDLHEKQIAGDPRIFVSFGIHPHFVLDWPFHANKLRRLLTSPICVGIGEIGIDLTSKCRHKPCKHPKDCKKLIQAEQVEFLKYCLPLAESLSKVLILHCRDWGSGEAAKKTLEIIQESGYTNLHIHRHCFVGTVEELNIWKQALPNAYFGFTATIFRDQETRKAVSQIPISRMILESDSPYLAPDEHCPVNNPWSVLAIASEISKIKDIPMSAVLQTTSDNTIQLYKF